MESKVKETVQSLETATQTFRVRNDIVKEESDLKSDMQNTVNRLWAEGQHQAEAENTSDEVERLSSDVKSVTITVSHTSSSIENTSNLLLSFPSKALTQQASDAKKDNIQLAARVDDLKKEIDMLSHPSKSALVATIGDLNSLKLKFVSVHNDASRGETGAATLSKGALDAAKQYQVWSQMRYQRYSAISYVLYVIGWCLPLFGRKFGVQGLEGIE
jgi:hypothetical protein